MILKKKIPKRICPTSKSNFIKANQGSPKSIFSGLANKREGVVNMSWTCCEHVVDMLWTCDENVMNILWTCCQHVVNLCWTCSKHVVKMWWKCGEHVVNTSLTCREHGVNMLWKGRGRVLFPRKLMSHYEKNIILPCIELTVCNKRSFAPKNAARDYS